ncbi:MAG: chemotaxis protein CheW [Gemmatimonadaceae bacterium]
MSETTTITRLVTFRVGTELFAADIFSVERVLRYEPARSMPNLPSWMEGVLEIAGRVVPVIDLRRRFGMHAPLPGSQARLLVLSVRGDWMGAVVDQVLDIRPVAPDEITPPPAIVRGIAGDYLRGVVRRGDSLVVVLDIDRILATTEQLALGAATQRDVLPEGAIDV